MKLFFGPASCSLASHIALHELGLKFEAERVDLKSKQTSSSGDFMKINPKGYVPALQLDNGEVLTEGAAILQYLGDLKPSQNLVPAAGTMERYRLQEWLNFIATEVHKGFSPLWRKDNPDIVKSMAEEKLFGRLNYLNDVLKGKDFAMGSNFTVVDAYLFTVLNWSNYLKIDLGRWPVLAAYCARVKSRPAVQAAMKAEGIWKE